MIENISKKTVLAQKTARAETLWEKIGGLLIRPRLQEGEALVIPSAAPSVHSFFMKYPIDVVFTDAKGAVVETRALPPWRMTRVYPAARCVIELPAGTIASTRTQKGDILEIG